MIEREMKAQIDKWRGEMKVSEWLRQAIQKEIDEYQVNEDCEAMHDQTL